MTAAYEHVMLDLELLGLHYGAGVLQIGIAFFNTDPSLDPNVLTYSLHPNVCLPGNASVCPKTDRWWHEEDPALYAELLATSKLGPSLADALTQLERLMAHHQATTVWADYPQFDIAHLQHAAHQLQREPLWSHRAVHSSNTLIETCRQVIGQAPAVADHPGRRLHDARSDAWQQALEVQACSRVLASLRR